VQDNQAIALEDTNRGFDLVVPARTTRRLWQIDIVADALSLDIALLLQDSEFAYFSVRQTLSALQNSFIAGSEVQLAYNGGASFADRDSLRIIEDGTVVEVHRRPSGQSEWVLMQSRNLAVYSNNTLRVISVAGNATPQRLDELIVQEEANRVGDKWERILGGAAGISYAGSWTPLSGFESSDAVHHKGALVAASQQTTAQPSVDAVSGVDNPTYDPSVLFFDRFVRNDAGDQALTVSAAPLPAVPGGGGAWNLVAMADGYSSNVADALVVKGNSAQATTAVNGTAAAAAATAVSLAVTTSTSSGFTLDVALDVVDGANLDDLRILLPRDGAAAVEVRGGSVVADAVTTAFASGLAAMDGVTLRVVRRRVHATLHLAEVYLDTMLVATVESAFAFYARFALYSARAATAFRSALVRSGALPPGSSRPYWTPLAASYLSAFNVVTATGTLTLVEGDGGSTIAIAGDGTNIGDVMLPVGATLQAGWHVTITVTTNATQAGSNVTCHTLDTAAHGSTAATWPLLSSNFIAMQNAVRLIAKGATARVVWNGVAFAVIPLA
jgi:hypothetical protein